MLARHPSNAKKGDSKMPKKCLWARCYSGRFSRWTTALYTAWESRIPYGYEDMTGFHYGRPPELEST